MKIFHTFIMSEQRGLHRGGGKKGQLTGLFEGKDTLKPEIFVIFHLIRRKF